MKRIPAIAETSSFHRGTTVVDSRTLVYLNRLKIRYAMGRVMIVARIWSVFLVNTRRA